MLIWTAKFSKKKLLLAAVPLAGLALAAALLWGGAPEMEEEPLPRLDTAEARAEYLGSWGWAVEPEPLETLQFLLPDPLTEPYLAYARLQAEQGFDFASCAGQRVTRYTYAVTNYPDRAGVQANLYLLEGVPVGGDLFCPGEGGFQRGLTLPTEE